jgi:hypothetical protein
MENNKKIIIGISLLAVAGIGFYFWKKNKDKKDALVNLKNTIDTPPIKSNIEPVNQVLMKTPIQEVKKDSFVAHKCSATGKISNSSMDAKTLEDFKTSCLKNGGMLVEIKNK